MIDEDDSWEEAVEEHAAEEIEQPDVVMKSMNDMKIEMLHKILWVFVRVLKKVDRPDINETIDFHILERLKIYAQKKELEDEVLRMILLFRLCTVFGIASRIYIVLADEIECFVECKVLNMVSKHHKIYNACVVSIDAMFRVVDQSYYFSSCTKQRLAVKYAIRKIEEAEIYKAIELDENGMVKCFDDLDNERMRIIPKTVEMFRRHPRYIVESMLRWNECIYPKRTASQKFKGETVYLRECVVRLKTKEQLYKVGKDVEGIKPYRIVKKVQGAVRLYAPWQGKDLVVEGFGESMYQEYFHVNFIPKECVYIGNDYAREIAYMLGFPYRICFHGFSRRMPVNKGIFLEKKNLYVFSNFLHEYCAYMEKNERHAKIMLEFIRWRKMIRVAQRYLAIRKHLGLGM
ncbi:DNA repair protein Rad4 [Ordospora colligata]|uniref:DNA repair protein Rad4 n=1 Tax=Ordospora colligata OC4 TaxID=1354746 RepID=A0A0B2UM88_9MICR|nr:DNA repair protein Rad4 [Ordospora colligata OC4]KHN70379.1 DNA repair protein Rad4 [Ordospora colligata OC4]TBU17129.1 DNA repair protein Rad4 [Ordospora colligata]TBU17379.1 DNA repair protein Rad4 [Ordospora colligata]TBU19559.1 DNA repair protein Rad4 [Ordospora colligata]